MIELIALGRPEGMEVLYDRYGALVYAVALRVLRDASAAEDVAQEAFLSVWRGAASYRPERGNVRSWLCTVARNRSIDRTRGRTGRHRAELPLEHVVADSAGNDPWVGLLAELDRDHIRAALENLPAVQRTTIELAYFGGLTQSEISDRMQAPLGTVKGRTRAALQALRGVLSGWCVEQHI
ncbi:MAG: sigma-70 family RNA polymerase sigma factor [Thermoplasmata archaeon]